MSPLYVASQKRRLQIVQLLIEYGALVNQANTVSCVSLPYYYNNNIIFLQSGQGDTALIVACYNGYSDIARILLDHGATIDYNNRVRSI